MHHKASNQKSPLCRTSPCCFGTNIIALLVSGFTSVVLFSGICKSNSISMVVVWKSPFLRQLFHIWLFVLGCFKVSYCFEFAAFSYRRWQQSCGRLFLRYLTICCSRSRARWDTNTAAVSLRSDYSRRVCAPKQGVM